MRARVLVRHRGIVARHRHDRPSAAYDPPMAKTTRGFFGRSKERTRGCRRASTTPATHWPVLNAEVTPHLSTDTWTFRVEGLVEQPDDVDLGRAARAARRRRTRAHPLRDDVVEVRHDVPRRLGRHAPRHRQAAAVGATLRRRVQPHRLHDEPAAGRRRPAARRGSCGRSTAARCRSTTAARPA